jgi:hypothetical protein
MHPKLKPIVDMLFIIATIFGTIVLLYFVMLGLTLLN